MKEREHLRFAVGKLGKFEKREKALYQDLERATQSAADARKGISTSSAGTSGGSSRRATSATNMTTSNRTAVAVETKALSASERISAATATVERHRGAAVEEEPPSETPRSATTIVSSGTSSAGVPPASSTPVEATQVQNPKNRAITNLVESARAEGEEAAQLVASPGGTFPTWNI